MTWLPGTLVWTSDGTAWHRLTDTWQGLHGPRQKTWGATDDEVEALGIETVVSPDGNVTQVD